MSSSSRRLSDRIRETVATYITEHPEEAAEMLRERGGLKLVVERGSDEPEICTSGTMKKKHDLEPAGETPTSPRRGVFASLRHPKEKQRSNFTLRKKK